MKRLIAAGAAALIVVCSARAEESKGGAIMPYARQNAVVAPYCGSCHSDALMYGGLSVEHFDAARADPTMAAMLLSKITSGHTPEDVEAAAQRPDGEAAILKLMKTGAMGAAGKGVPDGPTQVMFARALSAEAVGAEEWNVRTQPGSLSATILRQVASSKFGAGVTDTYRLILTCRTDSHAGEIRLAWANGVPEEGRLMTVAADGRASFTHKVEGGKKQGNGSNGPGATVLTLPLPQQSLSVADLFPDETVVFPFDKLSTQARRELSACFGRN